MKILYPIALALVLATSPALAQTTNDLQPGDRVRVTYRVESDSAPPTASVTGKFVDLTSERLRVSRSISAGDRDIPLDRLLKLEVSRRAPGSGAALGGLLGGLAGMAAGAAACNQACQDEGDDGISITFFGGIGAGAGALIGALVWKQWRVVQLDLVGGTEGDGVMFDSLRAREAQ